MRLGEEFSLVPRLRLGTHRLGRLCLPLGQVSDQIELREAEPRRTGVPRQILGTREGKGEPPSVRTRVLGA